MSNLTDEDKNGLAALVADACIAHYGVSMTKVLAGPLSVVMQTLEDAGALVPVAPTEGEKDGATPRPE